MKVETSFFKIIPKRLFMIFFFHIIITRARMFCAISRVAHGTPLHVSDTCWNETFLEESWYPLSI